MNLDGAEKYINQNVDILTFFNKRVVPLSDKLRPFPKAGGATLCPFHDEHDPSFHHWKSNNVFTCFGACNTSFPVVKLYMRAQSRYCDRHIERIDAIKEIIQLEHLDIVLDEKAVNVFQECRKKMEMNHLTRTEMSLSRLMQINSRINKADLSIDDRIELFSDLDLQAAKYYERKKSAE